MTKDETYFFDRWVDFRKSGWLMKREAHHVAMMYLNLLKVYVA